MSSAAKDFYEFGRFRLDAVERVLMRDGKPVALTQKGFDLLLLLVENRGHVVEKDRLMKETWPDTFVEEGNLTQNISVLRKVLRDDGHQYIQTVPRRGYRFVGHVRAALGERHLVVEEHSRARVIVEEQDDVSPADVWESTTPPTNRDLPAARARFWNHKRIGYAGAACVLIIIAATALALRYGRRSSERPSYFSIENYAWEKLSGDDKTGGMISPDGEFLVYLTDDGNGTWSVRQRRLSGAEAITILPAVKSNLWGMALTHDSSFLYYILADYDGATGTLYRISVLGGAPRKIVDRVSGGPSLSPDDQRVAFIRANIRPGVAALITANATDGSDERVVTDTAVEPRLYNAIWFPDGSRLLCIFREQRPDGDYWSLAEVAAGGGSFKQFTQPVKQHFWWDAWLPDGSGILLIATDPATGAHQLYLASYPEGSIQRITNDLNGYAGVISISSDGNKFVLNQVERHNRAWVGNAEDLRNARNTNVCCLDRLSWTPEGRIVYDHARQGKRQLWIMDADGANRQQLSPAEAVDASPSVSRDGRHIVFISRRTGRRQIWRTDGDGRNARQLTNVDSEISDPLIAPDGRMVYFGFGDPKKGRWVVARVPIDGGEQEEVEGSAIDLWDISPDGKQLAYSYFDEKVERWRTSVRALEGGRSANTFDFRPHDILFWTPDGTALVYKDASDPEPRSVLWKQLVNGGKPQRFLDVTPDTIYSAGWSKDGKQLAMIRGKITMNILMLRRLDR